jgi:hypothetical protein
VGAYNRFKRAAGLQLKMAGTPAKLDRIRRMPQKQVVRAMIKDREVYIWADGDGCECYYVGTRQNDEQLRHNQREEKADRRIDWYNAQHDDPLWLHRGWDDYFFSNIENLVLWGRLEKIGCALNQCHGTMEYWNAGIMGLVQ